MRRNRTDDSAGVPIAPMIDVVFLLLIYFMVSSSLERQEADLFFQLPGTVEQESALELPGEQVIEVRDDGQVIVNEYAYDGPRSVHLVELQALLTRFRQACVANKAEAMVTIAPASAVRHSRIIRVMDACSLAGIRVVHFALE